MLNNQPLFDVDTERIVLSTFINFASAGEYIAQVEPDMFYNPAHQKIFRVITELRPIIDMVSVMREMQGEIERGTLAEIAQVTGSVAMLPTHISYLREFRTKRIALRRAKEMVAALPTLNASEIKQRLAEAAKEIDYLHPQDEVSPIESYLSLLDARSRGLIKGISTGYQQLDHYIDGFLNGGLYVVAGRPKMGKTMFCINLIDNALRQGKRVLLQSLEMDSAEIFDLLFSRRMRCNSRLLKRNTVSLTDEQWQQVSQTANDFATGNIIIERGGRTVSKLQASIEKYKPELVVIDNLNLLRGERGQQSKVHEIGDITADLKVMAGDMNIPVLLIAHLNRQCDMRENKRPMLSDLRDSGSIEQDANVVMFVYRPGYYDRNIDQRICEIIIAANRSGEAGYLNFLADLSTSSFYCKEETE